MNFRSIQKSSTAELVIKELLNSIETGQLKSGDRLPTERELAKLFGVGRSTIREATSTLTFLGYLEVIQGRGTFLRKDFKPGLASFALDEIQAAANIIDLVEVREILECNVVRLAAQRADAEDIGRIRNAVVKMKESAADMEQVVRHDFEFHIALARSTGNQMIYAMMKQIVENVHTEYRKFMPKALFGRKAASLTAEQILRSITDGDGEEAAARMTEHLRLVTTELKKMVPNVTWIRKKRL